VEPIAGINVAGKKLQRHLQDWSFPPKFAGVRQAMQLLMMMIMSLHADA